jgi:hypothetical protein
MRFITVIAAVFFSQAMLCSTACTASAVENESLDLDGTALGAIGDAGSDAMPPCHQKNPASSQGDPGKPGAPDAPNNCKSCSVEASLVSASEEAPHFACLTLVSFRAEMQWRASAALDAPSGPNHGPPVAKLYLLKSSYLI